MGPFDQPRCVHNRKAIVWKDFKQAYVLEGHTAAIWAVLAIDDELILTGNMCALWGYTL